MEREGGKASKLQTNNIEIDINERMSCEKKGLFDLLICNCDLMMRAELFIGTYIHRSLEILWKMRITIAIDQRT
jgi:hypothetical protein